MQRQQTHAEVANGKSDAPRRAIGAIANRHGPRHLLLLRQMPWLVRASNAKPEKVEQDDDDDDEGEGEDDHLLN